VVGRSSEGRCRIVSWNRRVPDAAKAARRNMLRGKQKNRSRARVTGMTNHCFRNLDGCFDSHPPATINEKLTETSRANHDLCGRRVAADP
jgi:hypothetical protein